MKPIMVTLMKRLATYLSEPENDASELGDIFSLFRSHLQSILERAFQPPAQSQGNQPVPSGPPDMSAPLEVLAAFMEFTVSLYPDQVKVDIILGSAAELLQKYRSIHGD